MASLKTRFQTEYLIRKASKLIPADKVTVLDLMKDYRYAGMVDGLLSLAVPEYIVVNGRRFSVPRDLTDFSAQLTYGQRMFLAEAEQNDIGLIIRILSGYYYTQSGRDWDELKAMDLLPSVMLIPVVVAYPVANHLMTLMAELTRREAKLLHREPSADERAAGIDKLSKYSELSAVLFLQESFRCNEAEVMRKPYNDCLVRFMLEKERGEFQERYMKQISKQ